MPSILVNRTLDNIVMGVTEQYEEGVQDGQVREMVNCVPDLAQGILRRNPFIAEGLVKTGIIEDSTVVNALHPISGTDNFTAAITVGSDNHPYLFTISRSALAGHGDWSIIDLENGNIVDGDSFEYFHVPDDVPLKDAFKVLNIRDSFVVVNTTKKVTLASVPLNQDDINKYRFTAFYWVKATTSTLVKEETDSATGKTGVVLKGYTYMLNTKAVEAILDTTPTGDGSSVFTPNEILEALKNKQTNKQYFSVVDSFLYSTDVGGPLPSHPKTWDWGDSAGGSVSLGVWKNIGRQAELPAVMIKQLDGFITKVTNRSSNEEDDYYLKYSHGKQTWEETVNPYEVERINRTTMPIFFTFNPDTDKFDINDSDWGERKVGDSKSNPTPDFVNSTIDDVFFYNNRLCFVSNNSICMSQVKELKNFYRRTVRSVLDDDPILLTVGDKNNTFITDAVVFDSRVFLFAEDAQYELYSSDGPMSPASAEISKIGAYNYNSTVGVTPFRDVLYFTSENKRSLSLFEMVTYTDNQYVKKGVAEKVSQHLPTYLPSSLNDIVTHSGLGLMFMPDAVTTNQLIVVNISVVGGKLAQRAFHKWIISEDYGINSIHVVKDRLLMVLNNGVYGFIELKIPPEALEVEYADVYSLDGGKVEYESGITFPTFYYRGDGTKGTNRGRLQVRTVLFNVKEGSEFSVVARKRREYENGKVFPTWDDGQVWCGSCLFGSGSLDNSRIYYNDTKITTLGDSKTLDLSFVSNLKDKTKGFILETINYEALFYQRSTRVYR